MGEHQPGDVAADERAHLHIPDRVGRDDPVVDVRAGCPEQIGAIAERIGDQVAHRLALEHQQ